MKRAQSVFQRSFGFDHVLYLPEMEVACSPSQIRSMSDLNTGMARTTVKKWSRLVISVTHGGCERTYMAVNGDLGIHRALSYVWLPNRVMP